MAEGTITDTDTITYDGSEFSKYNDDIIKLVDKFQIS